MWNVLQCPTCYKIAPPKELANKKPYNNAEIPAPLYKKPYYKADVSTSSYKKPCYKAEVSPRNARKHNKMAQFDMKRADTPLPISCSLEKWCYSYNSFGIEGQKVLEAFLDRHYLGLSILSPYQHLAFVMDGDIMPSPSTELIIVLIDEIVSDGSHSDCIVILFSHWHNRRPYHNILLGSTIAWKDLYDPLEHRAVNEEWQVDFESYFSGGAITYDLSYVRGIVRVPLDAW